MLTQEEIEFITKNEFEDTSKLLFAKDRYNNLDIKHLSTIIEARKKIRHKIPLWFNKVGLDYPNSLSVEQCSSQKSAFYKQRFIEKDSRTIDLTGGLGVDSWAFSLISQSHCYIEKNKELFETVKDNFKILGCTNVNCINNDCESILNNSLKIQPQDTFRPFFDLAFIDPARRDNSSKRVYAIENCEPNLLKVKNSIYKITDRILAKISPMADVSHTLAQFPDCRELHVVAIDNECKEILLLLEKGFVGQPSISAVNIKGEKYETFSYTMEEERYLSGEMFQMDDMSQLKSGKYLYQPNKAILKAGAFKLISQRFSLTKLARNTHLYLSDIYYDKFPGRIFKIKEIFPFNKEGIKALKTTTSRAECFSVNFPLDTAALIKKLGIDTGGEHFIIATSLFSEKKVLLLLNKLF